MAISITTTEKSKEGKKNLLAGKLRLEKKLTSFIKVDEKILAKIFTAFQNLNNKDDIAVDPVIYNFIDSIADFDYSERNEGKFWEPEELIEVFKVMLDLDSSKIDQVLEKVYGIKEPSKDSTIRDLNLLRNIIEKTEKFLDDTMKKVSDDGKVPEGFFYDITLKIDTFKKGIARMENKRETRFDIKIEEALDIFRGVIEYLKYAKKRGVLVRFEWA